MLFMAGACIYKQYLTQYSCCCVITVISQKLVIFCFESQPPRSDYLVLACVALPIPMGAHSAEWWEPKISTFYPSTSAILGSSKLSQKSSRPGPTPSLRPVSPMEMSGGNPRQLSQIGFLSSSDLWLFSCPAHLYHVLAQKPKIIMLWLG